MNIRRLRRLADHLDSIPRRAFNMHEWVTEGEDSRPMLSSELPAALRRAHRNDYRCGMAACVGGHMLILFPKAMPPLNMLMYADVGKALGLCDDHTHALVTPDAAHRTPKQAARFIRKLIAIAPPCCAGPKKDPT